VSELQPACPYCEALEWELLRVRANLEAAEAMIARVKSKLSAEGNRWQSRNELAAGVLEALRR